MTLPVLLLILSVSVRANNEQIPGPTSPSQFQAWLNQWTQWRTDTRNQYKYNDSIYSVSSLLWTPTSYIQPQMMSHDRYFYDPVARAYTVDKYLNDLTARFGGIDSVLIWPTYPNIGIDNRNQYDLVRGMPGGTSGLKAMIGEFHAKGVKILFPFNPWDQGTRYEGQPDDTALTSLLVSIDADGFNGDTMGSIPQSYYTSSVNAGKPLALEPEGGGSYDTANWDTLGWGYWDYPFIPEVDVFKWLTTKRLTNVCDRWNTYKTDNLQFAFFNGDGYEAWENIWGIWNQIVPRDAEALRRVATLLRYFGAKGFLQSPQWEPFTPVLQGSQIFASKWPATTSDTNGETFWTIVNRGKTNTTGPQITLTNMASGLHYYNVYAGTELTPSSSQLEADGTATVTLDFDVEALGYGALLATPNVASGDLSQLLNTMKNMTQHPLEYYDNTWKFLPQQVVAIPPTPPVNATPAGMIKLAGGAYHFVVSGVEIEGDPLPTGVDVQYPWEAHPQRNHDLLLFINDFYIDKYPATNSDWKKFINDSKYTPVDPYNYLKTWTNGNYPAGWDNKPVTWISQDEARSYCKFYNKRLPHEWEWQYAAQGTTGSVYPWGNTPNSNAIPPLDNSRNPPPPYDVNAHPQGDSPFGVSDLTGNVWQWTDEYQDEHTRAAILRGGSYYRPDTSMWYFPANTLLQQHGKYLLMGDSLDRSGQLGFRCVADGPGSACLTNLCGTPNTPYYQTDLTKEGTVDWIHWGLNGASSVDRKASGGSRITFSQVGTGSVLSYNNNPNLYSWSDGTPTTSVTNTPTGIYASGQSNGFRVVVPATTTSQTLRLYVGVYQSVGKISAELSDGSAPAYSDSALSNQAGTSNGVYAFQYKAKSAGQNLTVTWTQASQICQDPLCATTGAPAAAVDLTREGSTDWIHWGLNGNGGDRKRGVTAAISNYTLVGSTGTPSTYNNNPVSYSWSDGTPTTSSGGTTTGVYVAGIGHGFSLTAPADTTPRVLRIYTGVWMSTGKLTVEFSDGSATWTDTSVQNAVGTTDVVYVLRYRAKSTGQTIKVTWTQLDGDGNVTLQAATLAPDADGNVTLQAATLQVTTTTHSKSPSS